MTNATSLPYQERMLAAMQAYSEHLERGDPSSPPIVSSAKYKLPGDTEAPYVYGRYSSPTLEAAESAISALTGAPALGFPSGMAAISAALFATLRQGDRVLLPTDGYFTVRALAESFLTEFGIEADTIDTAEMAKIDVSPYRLVWAETPSNPGLDLCDLGALSKKCRTAGALLAVDNTTATPLLQDPLSLGADLVISSDTKAMCGHADALFGHVASHRTDIMDRVLAWRKTAGAIAGPWESFLLHRGLMTLEIRLERMCDNAQAIAELAAAHEAVESTRYPGLPDDPSYPLAVTQMRRPGFIVGIKLESETAANRFIESCPAIFPSTSFGAVHTSAERRARWGDAVPPGYVRLSAGCEPTELLRNSIREALDGL